MTVTSITTVTNGQCGIDAIYQSLKYHKIINIPFNQFASIIGFRLDDFEWKYDDELANYCKILNCNLVIINHEEQKFYYFNNGFTILVL